MFSGLVEQKLNHNDRHYSWRIKDEVCKPKNTTPPVKRGGGSMISWWGFAAGRPGACHKIDDIMRKGS